MGVPHNGHGGRSVGDDRDMGFFVPIPLDAYLTHPDSELASLYFVIGMR